MDFSKDNFLAKLNKLKELKLDLARVRYFLLLVFTFSMPLVIHLDNTEYGYTKTIFTFLFISFLILLWIGELLLEKDKPVALTKIALPAGLIVLAGVLSLINAPSRGVVLQSLALFTYFFLIYLIVANTIKNLTEAKFFLVALITAGLAAAAYGLGQYLGLLRGPHGFAAGRRSIISVMGNRNYLAGFLAYLFLPTFSLIFISKSKLLKSFLLVCLGLSFFLFFPIGARGAWLGLAGGSAVFLTTAFLYKPKIEIHKLKVTLVVTLAVLFLAYVFAAAPGPLNSLLGYSAPREERPWGFFTPVIRPMVRELVEKGGARVEDWYIGVEMLRDNPVLGIGLGNYKVKFLEYRGQFLQTERGQDFGEPISRGAQAHNEYVQFTAEMGILGLVTLVVGLGIMLNTAFKRARLAGGDSRVQFLGTALIGGIVAFLLHSTVSFPAHLPASSFAFVAFLGLLNSRTFGDTDLQFSPSGLARYAVLSSVIVLMLTVSVFAYRDWRGDILMGKGRQQLQYGNYHLAKEHLNQSVQLSFQPRHSYYYLGVAEREIGNHQKALEYFEKSKGQFEPYQLYLQLGTLHSSLDNLEKAKGYLRDFLQLGAKPDLNVQAKYLLATIAIREGRIEDGSSLVDEALEIDPSFERAIILKGDIANHQGDIQKARESWQNALEVIDRKLESANRSLSRELPLEEYGDLRSKKERLTEERQQVKEKLAQFEN